MFKFIKTKIINWCLNYKEIPISEIYEKSEHKEVHIPDINGNQKFIGEGETDLLVQTPSGFKPIKRTLKTVQYQEWELILPGFKTLIAADDHIIMTSRGEVQMKNLAFNDLIYTTNGLVQLASIKKLSTSSEMYDLEINDEEHVYYTNGILSHNTTVIAMYVLWLAAFHGEKRCIIASKSMSHAVEIQSRIKYAYEELPEWIKPGCKFYNRTSIEFDNESKIICEATSEKTGRGSSPSIIFLDELAFISKRIQNEMWSSLAPALSTGGKFIITSTPNGDSDLFAQLWLGANSGTNSFFPILTEWHEHPDRGEAYYQEMLGQLGELKFGQEILCNFLSSDALLVSSIVLQRMRHKEPVFTSMGFDFWVPENELGGSGKTYLVSMDPSTGTGSDFTAIEVFDFPGLNQVAEFRSNVLNIPSIYSKFMWLIKKLSASTENGKAEVLYTWERNGIGEAVSALHYNDEKQPEDAELVSDDVLKFGLFTTNKKKVQNCIQLKTLIEKANGLTINSKHLIHELKHFVSKANSYTAKQGATDDLVMATANIMFLLKRLSEYNEDAFATVNDYIDPDASLDDSGDYVPFLVM